MSLKFEWFLNFFLLLLCTPHLQAVWLPGLFPSPAAISIMLEPAGDATCATLPCAEQVKTLLENRYGSRVRVVLTRFPGEIIQPLQNARFANRLDVNVYISIHFFIEPQHRPQIYLYQFSYGDTRHGGSSALSFYSYDKAYLINAARTTAWGRAIQRALEQAIPNPWYDVHAVSSLPFKSLIGIISPAIAFEIGLKSEDDWAQYAPLIADSLEPIFRELMA
jgi:hypothetical protein